MNTLQQQAMDRAGELDLSGPAPDIFEALGMPLVSPMSLSIRTAPTPQEPSSISGGGDGSEKKADPRYPFTHAYDYLRGKTAEHNRDVGFATPKFSRGDCAAICHAIAPTLGVTAEDLAKKIADYASLTPTGEAAP